MLQLDCHGWAEGLRPLPREEQPFPCEWMLPRSQQSQAICSRSSISPFPRKALALVEAAVSFQAPCRPAASFYFSLSSPPAAPDRLLSRKMRWQTRAGQGSAAAAARARFPLGAVGDKRSGGNCSCPPPFSPFTSDG